MKTAFHVVYTVLALNFAIPAVLYAVDPRGSLASFVEVGRLLGAAEMPHTEDSIVWRVLAIANVATLAFGCVLLQLNLRKWFPILTPLVFLKSIAAIGFLVAYLSEGYPAYLAVVALDTLTAAAMAFFAVRARRLLPA